MKAIAISDIGGGGGSVWASDHKSWHYSPKRSQNMFHPVSLPTEDHYTSSRMSRVSRSLFGPSDPTENQRLICEELSSRRNSDRSRWNFDFYQEKPISGRYDWRKVCNSSNKDNKNYSSGDKLADSIWSKNSKKCEDNYMDLKRSTNSWNKTEHLLFCNKSRSPDLKKKDY